MLCFGMVLAVAVAHRNLVVEEQRSANELHAARAFEAAEAGLEWALARVNDPTPLDDACLPSTSPAALSWRERMLHSDRGEFVPVTWNDGGTPAPLQGACVRDVSGWRCSCPSGGRPRLPEPIGSESAPAFLIELAAAARGDIVGVRATGCTRTHADAPCAASVDAEHEATARLEAAWALLPALHAAPSAALTVRGDLDAASAPLGVRNDDAAGGGLAVHAGGRIAAPALRIGAPAGSPLGASLASGDALLRSLPSDRFFARHFGMGAAAWTAQPAVRRVACGADCAAAIGAAIAAGARLLAVDGDATIGGPASFGSPDDPVILVVSGALRVSGDVVVHGVLHSATLQWDDATPGAASVRGAVLVAGDYRGNAAVDVRRDAALLARLATTRGSFIRIAGSWKDFR
jgi:hypothetical protein